MQMPCSESECRMQWETDMANGWVVAVDDFNELTLDSEYICLSIGAFDEPFNSRSNYPP